METPIDTGNGPLAALVGLTPPCVISETDRGKALFLCRRQISPSGRIGILLALLAFTALGAYLGYGDFKFWLAAIVAWFVGILLIWRPCAGDSILILTRDCLIHRTFTRGQSTDRTLTLGPGSRVEFLQDAEDQRVVGLKVVGNSDVLDFVFPLYPETSHWLHNQITTWLAGCVTGVPAESVVKDAGEDSSFNIPTTTLGKQTYFLNTKILVSQETDVEFCFALKTSGWVNTGAVLFFLIELFLLPNLTRDTATPVRFIVSILTVFFGIAFGMWLLKNWIDVNVLITRNKLSIARRVLFWEFSRVLSAGSVSGARLHQGGWSSSTDDSGLYVSLFGEFGSEGFGSFLDVSERRTLVGRIRRFLQQDENLSLLAIPSDCGVPSEVDAEGVSASPLFVVNSRSPGTFLLDVYFFHGRASRGTTEVAAFLMGGLLFVFGGFIPWHNLTDSPWKNSVTEVLSSLGGLTAFLYGLFLVFGQLRIQIDCDSLHYGYRIGPFWMRHQIALSAIQDLEIKTLRPKSSEPDLLDVRCISQIVTKSSPVVLTRRLSGAAAILLNAIVRREIHRSKDLCR